MSKKPQQTFTKNSKRFTKRNSTKSQRRDKEIVDTAREMAKDGCERSRENDFEWYDKYALYTEYAGTIPFGAPIGQNLSLTTTGIAHNNVIPGIMTLRFMPTIGYSANRNSPINRSSIRWYSMLRKAQKASSNYDSQDMMMAYMAIDSLAMFHEVGKRIIGIANMNSVLNRYIPEGLLTAMNVDPQDVRNNLADWWGYINKFAIDASNVVMPKGMTLRDRHEWMCSGLYTDGESERSQIYLFYPDGFWQYNNTVETGSQLDYVKWPSGDQKMTLASYKVMGNALLSALFADEDIGTISGDTQNAIGPNRCYAFQQITFDYRLDALYSELVLSQIENSTAVNAIASSYTPVITQNPSVNNGAILFTPSFQYSQAAYATLAQKKLLFNFHHEKPSVKDTIEASRMRTSGAINTSTGILTPTSFGSEIILFYQIWTSKVGDPQTFEPTGTFGSNVVFDYNLNQATEDLVLQYLSKLASFDWHPIQYLYSNSTSKVLTYNGALVDYDVTAVLDTDKLADMHEAALTSCFAVPESYFNS